MQGLEFKITVGELEFFDIQKVWVESSRYRPISLAGIVVADTSREVSKQVKKQDIVSIEFGHKEKEKVSWTGVVTKIKPTDKIDEIEICASANLELIKTLVNESYENETPGAIVKNAINKSGLVPGAIEDPGIALKHFTADSIPVWQVAQQCLNTCRLSNNLPLENWALWTGKDEKINFSGDFEKPGIEITFEDYLIRNSLNCGYGRHRIEALLLPELHSSMEFLMNDSLRDFEWLCNALDVRHEIVGPKARTIIDYKVV
ncbi:MAG: hypothetical protein GY714_10425 [Desulfobacterales bacterium]|nr:hypothetical protein [Desulfobacterales bacterium]